MGQQLHAASFLGGGPKLPFVLRLGELIDAFVERSPMFLDNAASTRADTRRSLSIVRAVIGERCDVSTLTENDVRQYEARRSAGGVRYGNGRCTGPVRQRAIEADIKSLKQALYWACTQSTADERRWLGQNPLRHVKMKGEADPKRPVADYDRFEKTIGAMRKLQSKYAGQAQSARRPKSIARARTNQQSWIRAELALTVLEATGRRRGSVMALQWSDFDFTAHTIRWRPEHDKRRKTSVIKHPQQFFGTMREFQLRLGAVGGYLFPRRDDPQFHAPAQLLSQWIRTAEDQAGLEKLAGGVTHPYRRKWASERMKNHSVKAVMVAGGWTDLATVNRCYDHPDDAAILAVTSDPNKRGRPAARLETAAEA
jgi:integrase